MSNRQEILDLLAKGKISAAEAADLLNSAKEAKPTPEMAAPTAPAAPAEPIKTQTIVKQVENGAKPSWFRVRVRNLETGKNKVSVNIPIRMLNFGLKIGNRFAPELADLDYNELTGMMDEIGIGMLVEVEDEDSNEHVQVYVE